MDRTELEKKVIELIAVQISIDAKEVSTTSDFVNDLGFDSLDAVEIIMCIEDDFGISIPYGDAEGLTTVKLTVDSIENNMTE